MNIAFVVNNLCQHMHAPSTPHYHKLQHLHYYIKGTINYRLPISKGLLHIQSYLDAKWSNDVADKNIFQVFVPILVQR